MNGKEGTIHVSIIIPMKNSSTTILHTLDSITSQDFKAIREIIIIDNASKDNSVSLVRDFAKKTKIPITVIAKKVSKTVAASYNLGVKKAKSSYVVFMHSDLKLPTKYELGKLIKPFYKDKEIVVSCPIVLHPLSVWNTYSFWEKAHFSRVVETEAYSGNAKFECQKKRAFLKVGGFDEDNFGGNLGGGEDADLHLRLNKIGKVARSSAKAVHLHYLGGDYSFSHWMANRKLLARTYGRFIRVKYSSLPKGAAIFGVKPLLAVIPFLPFMVVPGIILLFVYSLFVTKKMFTTRVTLLDPRIFLLPFINIFFVYYETFWMAEAFMTAKTTVKKAAL